MLPSHASGFYLGGRNKIFYMSVPIDPKRPWLKKRCKCGGAMGARYEICGSCRSKNNRENQICTCGNKKSAQANKCAECWSKNWKSENNSNWKGDKVGKAGMHNWVRRHKPKPDKCVRCLIREPKDLANISQNYKRDIDDYEWLCRRCHMHDDGRIYNLWARNRRRTEIPKDAIIKKANFPDHWERR